MNSSNALASLYSIMNKLLGPIEAKRSVTTAINLVICDIQDEGLEVTPELIESKIASYVKDFVEVAEKNKVA
jgi:hypothetical protein